MCPWRWGAGGCAGARTRVGVVRRDCALIVAVIEVEGRGRLVDLHGRLLVLLVVVEVFLVPPQRFPFPIGFPGHL